VVGDSRKKILDLGSENLQEEDCWNCWHNNTT